MVKFAERLVARGLRVMVYGPSEGAWGGVFYRHYSRWIPSTPIMAFISWRNPTVFDMPIQAQFKYLWMHDTDAGDMLTPERAEKITGVMALSQWHVDHLTEKYPFLGDKCFIVGNGIDPDRFTATPERNLHRFVYLSSPDRGLVKALELWPGIKDRLPDAELHIFYGWENYDKMHGSPEWKMEIMAKSRQDGVVWHGRIGQQHLATELLQSSVMLYPADPFNETFCIAALEAQAAGCVPLTRNNGALPETNARGILLPNDASDEAWCTSAVKATETKDSRRQFLHEWAITQTWDAVAQRFLNNIRQRAPKPEAVVERHVPDVPTAEVNLY